MAVFLNIDTPVRLYSVMVLKPFDIILSLISLIMIILFTSKSLTNNEDNSFITVKVDKKNYIYPVDKDRTLTFSGILGDTKVKIEGGKAAIIESPCRNHTCIEMGEIDKNGESAACLPNRVIVTVEGGESEVDIISY